MSEQEFLLLLDDLFEEDPGTYKGDEPLEEIEMWDSLTALGYIALVDEKFNVILSGNDIEKCQTIGDLVKLATRNEAD